MGRMIRATFAVAALVGLGLLGATLVSAGSLQTPGTPTECPPPAGANAQTASQSPDEIQIGPGTVAKRVAAKPGDICMLCNHPVDAGDVVYAARGQRVPIHQAELDNNVAWQVQLLFARLEPRGAFLGAVEGGGASRIWFFAGLYILIGLIFAALCAHRALHTGYSPLAWFGIGLVVNIVGYVLLLTRPKREVIAPAGIPKGLHKISATYAPQPCALCGTLNHPAATACIGCGARLEPKMKSEVARVGLRSA